MSRRLCRGSATISAATTVRWLWEQPQGIWKSSGRFLPQALAVTVDDGYRDFFDRAYPDFSEVRDSGDGLFDDWISGPGMLVVDRPVALLFEYATNREELPSPPFPGDCRMDTSEQRVRSAKAVKEAMKRLPNAESLRLLAALPDFLGARLPDSIPESYAPLTWGEVRLMRRHGIEFGAHTVTHPILAGMSNEADVRGELARSKARIEEELQEPVWHFAYPNGRREDIPDFARKAALAEGSGPR